MFLARRIGKEGRRRGPDRLRIANRRCRSTPDAEPGRNRRNFHRSRYDRYRGGPDPLAPPLDLREALDEIGADVMAGSSPRRAIRELLRRGMPGMRGLDELRERINRRRNEMLRNRNLDGRSREIRELLDRAVLEERKQLARDLDDDARFAEMQLGNLPPTRGRRQRTG